jgi:hypothetical protein
MKDTYHLCMCTISASTAKGSRPLYPYTTIGYDTTSSRD